MSSCTNLGSWTSNTGAATHSAELLCHVEWLLPSVAPQLILSVMTRLSVRRSYQHYGGLAPGSLLRVVSSWFAPLMETIATHAINAITMAHRVCRCRCHCRCRCRCRTALSEFAQWIPAGRAVLAPHHRFAPELASGAPSSRTGRLSAGSRRCSPR